MRGFAVCCFWLASLGSVPDQRGATWPWEQVQKWVVIYNKEEAPSGGWIRVKTRFTQLKNGRYLYGYEFKNEGHRPVIVFWDVLQRHLGTSLFLEPDATEEATLEVDDPPVADEGQFVVLQQPVDLVQTAEDGKFQRTISKGFWVPVQVLPRLSGFAPGEK